MIANIFSGFFGKSRIDAPLLRIVATIFSCVWLTSCATRSTHPFAEPTNAWRMRTGQLLYRTASTTIIGEVAVRSSREGSFELTFSKGPGVTLISIQQDATFARVAGGFARKGWSGPVDRAPPQLLGWLQLRQRLIQREAERTIDLTVGAETFLFRF